MARQPVPGALIIGLSEHVDYWDRQGWKDRFSDHLFTQRQTAYAAASGSTDVYTPQMFVDGSAPFVGSDRGEAIAAIRRAAAQPKPPVTLNVSATVHVHRHHRRESRHGQRAGVAGDRRGWIVVGGDRRRELRPRASPRRGHAPPDLARQDEQGRQLRAAKARSISIRGGRNRRSTPSSSCNRDRSDESPRPDRFHSACKSDHIMWSLLHGAKRPHLPSLR